MSKRLINSFAPTIMGKQLDMMSAKPSLTIVLSDIVQVNALKHTVDPVNDKITLLFRQYLDDTSWEELSIADITLCAGMLESSKHLYQTMMTKNSNNGKLNKQQLRVTIAKENFSLLELNQTQSLEILDIIDLLAKHYLSGFTIVPNKTESEMAFCRKFVRIIDEFLSESMLEIMDGEITCKVSKPIAKSYEKMYNSALPLDNGFGRRIDTIVSTHEVELSTSEWEKKRLQPTKCLQQQAKYIKMNKTILTYLLDLEKDDDRIFTVERTGRALWGTCSG